MARLISHVIDGQVIGVDLLSWSLIKVPFRVLSDTHSLESMPLGYTDISSIEHWWDYGQDLNRDYLFVRDEIKKLVVNKGLTHPSVLGTITEPTSNPTEGDRYILGESIVNGWAAHAGFIGTYTNNGWVIEPPENVGYRLLNSKEKLICAELKIGGQADHFHDYGVPTIVDYGVEFHRKAIACREERMLRTTVEIYNRLPMNSYEVLVDLTAGPFGNIIDRYKQYGVKGTLEDYHVDFNPNPTPGICDYVLGRAPFNGQAPYTNAGLPAGLILKGWNPIDSANITIFANEIYSILTKGYFL